MIKDIVKDRTFLKLPSEPADKSDRQTVIDLCDTLEANKERCVGMAANMIGVRKRILAAYLSGKLVVMINPVIIGRSGEPTEETESCLSLIGSAKALRYPIISVEYLDRTFKRKKAIFRGFDAQIIQHETDHFEGILI